MLSSSILLIAATAASGALAIPAPLVKRVFEGTPTVTQILQYALTLEHLESTFYSQALAKFDEDAFAKAGLPTWARGRFAQIGQHEATHVATLTSALGKDAVAACNYSFPYNDPMSFAVLSATLEGVGTSAYLGGAGDLVSSPSVLTVAGAILPVEARHNAWVTSAILHDQPWNGAFETPLDQNQVFTLASSFITSCPSSNPALPFTAFPALAFEGTLQPGQSAKVSFNASSSSGTLSVAFLSGLNTTFAPLGSGNSVTVPQGLQGMVYAIVTNSSSNATDADTIAGPAILEFPFASSASNAE